MAQTARVLEATTVLSDVLTTNGINHAFHGNFLIALMAGAPQCTVCQPQESPQSATNDFL